MKYFSNYSFYLSDDVQGIGAFVQDITNDKYERFEDFCRENALIIHRRYPYYKDDADIINWQFIISELTDEQAVLLKLTFS